MTTTPFLFSDTFKKYIENVEKDGNGNWRQGTHGYNGIALGKKLGELFGGYESEDYEYIITKLAEDKKLARIMLRLEDFWYEAWYEEWQKGQKGATTCR